MISWLLFKVWSIWSLRQAKMTLLLHRNKGSKSFWSDSVSLFDRGLDDFCIRNLFLFITFHVTTQTDMRISRLDRGCVVFLCTIVKPSFKLFIYIVNKLDSGCISTMRIFYLNFLNNFLHKDSSYRQTGTACRDGSGPCDLKLPRTQLERLLATLCFVIFTKNWRKLKFSLNKTRILS